MLKVGDLIYDSHPSYRNIGLVIKKDEIFIYVVWSGLYETWKYAHNTFDSVEHYTIYPNK